MEGIARLGAEERSELFSETASVKGLSPAVVEKDFWVCWTLKQLFTYPELKGKLMFKGGTALSKVFGLIQRFSEDIDLIIHPELVTKVQAPDHTMKGAQRDKVLDRIKEDTRAYNSGKLHPLVSQLLEPFCQCQCLEDEHGGAYISIEYPGSHRDNALQPQIILEPGPLALWEPHGSFPVVPIIAEVFANRLSAPSVRVDAILAERTFWEKATILHEQAHRTEDKPVPQGYSRHYYDLFCMANSEVRSKALQALKLLQEVADYKRCCYPRAWAQYDLARPGTLCLLPTPHVERDLRRNYIEAESMYFGERPGFDEILATLAALEKEINSLSWPVTEAGTGDGI